MTSYNSNNNNINSQMNMQGQQQEQQQQSPGAAAMQPSGSAGGAPAATTTGHAPTATTPQLQHASSHYYDAWDRNHNNSTSKADAIMGDDSMSSCMSDDTFREVISFSQRSRNKRSIRASPGSIYTTNSTAAAAASTTTNNMNNNIPRPYSNNNMSNHSSAHRSLASSSSHHHTNGMMPMGDSSERSLSPTNLVPAAAAMGARSGVPPPPPPPPPPAAAAAAAVVLPGGVSVFTPGVPPPRALSLKETPKNLIVTSSAMSSSSHHKQHPYHSNQNNPLAHRVGGIMGHQINHVALVKEQIMDDLIGVMDYSESMQTLDEDPTEAFSSRRYQNTHSHNNKYHTTTLANMNDDSASSFDDISDRGGGGGDDDDDDDYFAATGSSHGNHNNSYLTRQRHYLTPSYMSYDHTIPTTGPYAQPQQQSLQQRHHALQLQQQQKQQQHQQEQLLPREGPIMVSFKDHPQPPQQHGYQSPSRSLWIVMISMGLLAVTSIGMMIAAVSMNSNSSSSGSGKGGGGGIIPTRTMSRFFRRSVDPDAADKNKDGNYILDKKLHDELMLNQEKLLVTLAQQRLESGEHSDHEAALDPESMDWVEHFQILQHELVKTTSALSTERTTRKQVEADMEQLQKDWWHYKELAEYYDQQRNQELQRFYRRLLLEKYIGPSGDDNQPIFLQFHLSLWKPVLAGAVAAANNDGKDPQVAGNDSTATADGAATTITASTVWEEEPAFFTIEMAPIDLMPASVYVFLEQAATGFLDGTSFHINAPHMLWHQPKQGGNPSVSDPDYLRRLNAMAEHGLKHVPFAEYSEEYPHVQYTLGFSGIATGAATLDEDPLTADASPNFPSNSGGGSSNNYHSPLGNNNNVNNSNKKYQYHNIKIPEPPISKRPGPSFYINKMDNMSEHAGDPCFAKIVVGTEVMETLKAWSMDPVLSAAYSVYLARPISIHSVTRLKDLSEAVGYDPARHARPGDAQKEEM